MTASTDSLHLSRPETASEHARGRRLRRLLTIGIAVVAALVLWLLPTQVVGTDLTVDQGMGRQPVLVPLVLAAPILSGFTGWGLLALLERLFGRRGRTAWRVIAIVVMVLSCTSPLLAATSVGTAGWLVAMHLVVGLILIIGFAPRRR